MPSTRQAILDRIVTQVVQKWEVQATLDPEQSIGVLDGASARDVLLHGYAIIAKEVLDKVTPSASEIDRALMQFLELEWSLGQGPRRVTAQSIREFWDHRGIFVAEGEDERVTAPIQLLAEIGYVQFIVRQSQEEQEAWFRHDLESYGVREVSRLAAEKIPALCDALITTSFESGDKNAIAEAVEVVLRGGEPSDRTLRMLIDFLIEGFHSVASDTFEIIWWLTHLPISEDQFEGVEREVESCLDEKERVLWQVWAAQRRPESRQVTQAHLCAFIDEYLRTREPVEPVEVSGTFELKVAHSQVDSQLDDLFIWACECVFEDQEREYIADVAEKTRDTVSLRVWQLFSQILPEQLRDRWQQEGWFSGISNANLLAGKEARDDAEQTVLKTIAESHAQHDLSLGQRRKLNELSAIINELVPGETPASEFPRAFLNSPEETIWLVEFVLQVFDAEEGIVASQAAQALDEFDDRDAIFSFLWDEAPNAEWGGWKAVDDKEAAVDKLLSFFKLDWWFAKRVFPYLIEYPDSAKIVVRLEPYLESLHGRRRYDAAKLYLCHLPPDSPVRENWLGGDSWSERAALSIWALRLWDNGNHSAARRVLTRLVNDPDNLVRRLAFSETVGFETEALLPTDTDAPSAYESCYNCGKRGNACECTGRIGLRTDSEFREMYGE